MACAITTVGTLGFTITLDWDLGDSTGFTATLYVIMVVVLTTGSLLLSLMSVREIVLRFPSFFSRPAFGYKDLDMGILSLFFILSFIFLFGVPFSDNYFSIEAYKGREEDEACCDCGCGSLVNSCTVCPYYDVKIRNYRKLVRLLLRGVNRTQLNGIQPTLSPASDEPQINPQPPDDERTHILSRQIEQGATEEQQQQEEEEKGERWMNVVFPCLPALIDCKYLT